MPAKERRVHFNELQKETEFLYKRKNSFSRFIDIDMLFFRAFSLILSLWSLSFIRIKIITKRNNIFSR